MIEPGAVVGRRGADRARHAHRRRRRRRLPGHDRPRLLHRAAARPSPTRSSATASSCMPACGSARTASASPWAARGHLKVPQIGRVIIQDDVEIGANTTIDRGALKDTIIGEGTKIDNLVQIGHNVVIGRHCVIVGQCGISGSTELGDFVVMGGQSGAVGHIKIGTGAQIAGASHPTGRCSGRCPHRRDAGAAAARSGHASMALLQAARRARQGRL